MIIILEGMSTAGKTMIQKELSKILMDNNIENRMVDQNEGLPPEIFSHLDSKRSYDFLVNFIKEIANKDKIFVCDRLHLSHAAITNWEQSDLMKIEAELLKHNPLLIMLVIDEKHIKVRLEGAIQHRGDQWATEMDRRGRNDNSHIEWFTGTQNRILDLYNASKLPKVIFDTSGANFAEIAMKIFNNYIKEK